MTERDQRETGREWTGWAAYHQVFVFSAVYHFLFCILVSSAILSKPLIGAILYLFGRVVSVSVLRLRPPRSGVLSGKEKWSTRYKSTNFSAILSNIFTNSDLSPYPPYYDEKPFAFHDMK